MTTSARRSNRIENAGWSPTLLLLVGVLLAFAVRYEMYVDGRHRLTHDESITFVAATGNLENYETAWDRYSSRWMPAREWEKFTRISGWVSPAKLAEDLAQHDIHPPLYFTILHVWAHAFGIEQARLLNLLFVALTCAALYGLGIAYFGNRISAALVVLAWLFNPEAIRVSAEARQYELLTLAAVVFGWQTYRLIAIEGRATLGDLAGFGVAACLGMLTQYIFILTIFAALLAIVLSSRALLLKAMLALIAAAAAFVAVHPTFYLSFLRFSDHAAPVTSPGFAANSVEVAKTFLGFYGWRASWMSELLAVVTLFLLAILFVVGAVLVVRHDRLRPIVCLALVPSALIVGLYLAGRMPSHAMGPKYLASVWPYLAFLHVALFVRYLPRLQIFAVATFAVVVGPAMLAVAVVRVGNDPLPNTHPVRAVVTDNLTSAYFLRFLRRYTDANTLVFAERQDKLIDKADAWIDNLKPGDLVILNPSYTGTPQGQAQLIDIIKQRHRLEWIRPEYSTTLVKIAD